MRKQDLEKENGELHQELERLKREKEQLKKKVAELEHQLAFFNNPHTPPSKQIFKKKAHQVSRKLGAPIGHDGATRVSQEPNEVVNHLLTKCPKCNDLLDKPFEWGERVVEEIPEPRPVKVTKHMIGFYNCKNCGVVSAEANLPEGGNFGKNTLSHVTLMKYDDRLPARKIENSLKRQHNLIITHTTILQMIQRVVKIAKSAYEKIKASIKTFFNVYIDETSIKVNGKTFWIWIFTTLTTTLFVIRESRHCKVIEEVLGLDFDGVINCDGWQTYQTYRDKNGKVHLQRCWAHPIREVEAVADKSEQVKPLNKWFKDIYVMVCKARESEKPLHTREKLKQRCEEELRKWLDVAKPYQELKTVRTKIENGFEHWFTCIIYPEVEPTNNRSERGLREQVVIEKITGTLRNEKGTTANEVIMTLITTWKQQNKNPFLELRALL